MEKIKQFTAGDKGKDILIVIIVILVGASSFGLGRLSKNTSTSDIKIEYPAQYSNQSANALSGDDSMVQDTNTSQANSEYNSQNSNSVPKIENSVGKSFFASKRGHKYYTIGCSAGKSIKPENRIYFATKAEAEKKGFSLSSSCD